MTTSMLTTLIATIPIMLIAVSLTAIALVAIKLTASAGARSSLRRACATRNVGLAGAIYGMLCRRIAFAFCWRLFVKVVRFLGAWRDKRVACPTMPTWARWATLALKANVRSTVQVSDGARIGVGSRRGRRRNKEAGQSVSA